MKTRERRAFLWAVPVWLALSLGVTVTALWCQPNAFRLVAANFQSQPLLILLNSLPIALLILAGAFLLRNVFFSAAAVNLCAGLLSIANRIKLEVRDEPVFPRDFALLKEVGSALGDYHITVPVVYIAGVILVTLALTLIGIVHLRRPLWPRRQLRWRWRVPLALVPLAALTGLILTLYASVPLYDSFKVSNAYYIPSVFNELGFPYCFCHQFTTFSIDRPEGFSRAEAEAWETGDRTGLGKDVHVIMVMDEAFSDLSDDPVFTYTEENDPLTNLHALQDDPHAIAGRLVVPGFAGGTANTEFDVLTGMQTNALSATTTSAMRTVNRRLDSLFRVFKNDGYRTSFFHPGDDWFYNRENVYRWLGAETTVFADEMPDKVTKGRWVTDDYMAGLIEQEFEDAVADGETLFHYTTTIQNHMAYTADKYGADYVFPELETDLALSDLAQTLLKVYIEGARDGDVMLGRLHDYFAAREEPVLLVFWGDHLPYLGNVYQEIGSQVALPEDDRSDPLFSYEVPYVIWANDAAADALDWEAAVAALDLRADNELSASFLGSTLLELTGRQGESPWFDFLISLRREAPVVQKKLAVLPDGTVVKTQKSETLAPLLARWRKWSYYKLKYKVIP